MREKGEKAINNPRTKERRTKKMTKKKKINQGTQLHKKKTKKTLSFRNQMKIAIPNKKKSTKTSSSGISKN